jgi:hypothetical protein
MLAGRKHYSFSAQNQRMTRTRDHDLRAQGVTDIQRHYWKALEELHANLAKVTPEAMK